MQLLEFAPVFVSAFLLGKATSPEWRRAMSWRMQQIAKGQWKRGKPELQLGPDWKPAKDSRSNPY